MNTQPPVVLLDGATGTELDRRGVDISLPLWSARAILEAPDELFRVHLDYLEAGAQLVTTCTFRTHRRTLAQSGLGDRAADLTTKAVQLAQAACGAHGGVVRVAGSVGPLEDCYRPDLAPDAETCEAEHREIIGTLVAAGVDLVLLETMNNRAEALAAARAAQDLAPGQWAIGFCPAPHDPAGMLLSGEPFADLLPALGDAWAIGVNCAPADRTVDHVRLLARLLPEHIRVAAWANIGRPAPDGSWVSTDAIEPERYADHVEAWIDAGASLVGGCCGTRPETTAAIARRIAG
ncbi:MAG: homocysteine S-methyltransferase family protein [Planctomycetota bacterium]|jgi:homocysteine S-methyltransferase